MAEAQDDAFGILGVYRPGVYRPTVHWYRIIDHQHALSEVARNRNASLVLFDRNGVPVLFSGVHSKLDVAIVLHAYRTNDDRQDQEVTTVNRKEVKRVLTEEEDLPIVPTSPSIVQQWLLKRAMDLVFNRYSVRFFACGPLRWKSLYYFDVRKCPAVRGHVALTLDDAPCRFSSKRNSRISEVAALLGQYGAKATFMVIGAFVRGHEDDLVALLKQGHELGNHGMKDLPCNWNTREGFRLAVNECNQIIQALQRRAREEPPHGGADVPQQVRWFRAPHGKYTYRMASVLAEQEMQNVMCDTYASCPLIQDGEYVGRSLAKNARDGSILLLHMPERGFRDWCMVALRRLLEELRERHFVVVTKHAERLTAGMDYLRTSLTSWLYGSHPPCRRQQLWRLFAQLRPLERIQELQRKKSFENYAWQDIWMERGACSM